MITSGGIEALELVGKSFLDPGDVVVVEAPTYLGSIQSFRSFEATLVPVSFDEHGLAVDELEQRLAAGLRPKLVYTIPDHQNPAGVSLAADRRAALVELARSYGFLVIEDVAYRDLGFEGVESRPSLWSLGPDVVVQAGTTSKTLFPGVRLGWAAGPEGVVGRLVAAKQLTDQCAGALGQRLFEESERRGWIDEQLERSRALYRRKSERMLAALERAMPESAHWTTPRGGFFSWLTLPGVDAVDLAGQAVERGVAARARPPVLPGRPGHGQSPPLLQPRRRGEDRRGDRTPGVAPVSEPSTTHYRWDDLPKEALKEDLGRRLISTERMMLAQVFLEKGCIVPRHAHENEQLTYILEGTLRFWLGEDEAEMVDVRAGEVLHIPPWVPHKAEALETTLDVDIFCPPRQDWLDGSDAYLRSK